MDCQLREVLRQERYVAHQLAKYAWLAQEVKGVIDAERVQNGGQKHVLSNKGSETGALKIGLEESIAKIISDELNEHVEWEEQVDDGERERRDDPGLINLPTIDQDVDEADIEEGVSSCDGPHKQLYNVPFIEMQ